MQAWCDPWGAETTLVIAQVFIVFPKSSVLVSGAHSSIGGGIAESLGPRCAVCWAYLPLCRTWSRDVLFFSTPREFYHWSEKQFLGVLNWLHCIRLLLFLLFWSHMQTSTTISSFMMSGFSVHAYITQSAALSYCQSCILEFLHGQGLLRISVTSI